MSEGDIIKIAQSAIRTILTASAPMLIFSLAVGLVISIFQAVTQIQESTLAFVPKIIAVLLALVIFGPWILKVLTEFTSGLLTNINSYIQ
ncbi:MULTISPECIES: flagellar biosynthesis protein FliQ [Tissierellales]|jgi:flagellar biosynthetic protein FliQ|uniref:Flagellar biosynthetic protein FliQ n=1 Tax=Acidilutibacter cellobiosedens TaxID=2507161 RepID=A0A410QC32_9FIRM|nr:MULTISPECIES: flagellar biosynthesis protein FliQ [Tissierellales]MBE6081744.1 flagellar biosynthesis protein FliQ [Tissierellaceae bacterium]QAT61622.1 flagellar biosynthesis protein FliQ [Acidilutibacter cellobiosedens]SCL83057.1 Flagellar biosynthetic protein FliQ [Sporanaerobacter sp. PP17-6a]